MGRWCVCMYTYGCMLNFHIATLFYGGRMSWKNRAKLAKFFCWHRTHLQKDGLLYVIFLFKCLWCYIIDLTYVPGHYSEEELLLQKRFSEKSWSVIQDSIEHWVSFINNTKIEFFIYLILRIHLKLEHYWEFEGENVVWCYDSINEE